MADGGSIIDAILDMELAIEVNMCHVMSELCFYLRGRSCAPGGNLVAGGQVKRG